MSKFTSMFYHPTSILQITHKKKPTEGIEPSFHNLQGWYSAIESYWLIDFFKKRTQ